MSGPYERALHPWEKKAMTPESPERALLRELAPWLSHFGRKDADNFILHITAILSAPPAAQQAAPEWRPIETAPKDGTHLLLCVSGYLPAVGFYHSEWGEWVCHIEDGMPEDWEHDSYIPTHWMPLPAAPQPKEEGHE